MRHLNNDTDFSSKNSEQYPPRKPEGTERKACFQMISLELFPTIALQSHTSRSRIKRQIEITIQNIPANGRLRLSGHHRVNMWHCGLKPFVCLLSVH